jgi:hypothetical protein
LINPGFQGALLGLTDHFSVPFDDEDVFFNVFNLRLAPGDQISKALGTNVWHDMELDWDCNRQEVRVTVDAHQVALMRQMRIPQNQGISYLRLRSVGESGDDAGFMIESVDVAVSGKDQGD